MRKKKIPQGIALLVVIGQSLRSIALIFGFPGRIAAARQFYHIYRPLFIHWPDGWSMNVLVHNTISPIISVGLDYHKSHFNLSEYLFVPGTNKFYYQLKIMIMATQEILTIEMAKQIVAPLYDSLNQPANKDVNALLAKATVPDYQSYHTHSEFLTAISLRKYLRVLEILFRTCGGQLKISWFPAIKSSTWESNRNTNKRVPGSKTNRKKF